MAKKKKTEPTGDKLVWVKFQIPDSHNRVLKAAALLENCTAAEVLQRLVDEHLRPAYGQDK